MQVEVNSIWQVRSLDGNSDGLYRVLAIYSEIDLLIHGFYYNDQYKSI